MKNPILFLALLATLSGFSAPPAGAASQRGFSVEVLVGGARLEEFRARGTTYVEARRGRDYELRLTNPTGERVAVALSVDGLNVIDARTTSARDASKWILEPWQTITIRGWQTGRSTARRFFFTDEERSYGAWLGRTRDLGVISAAFFKEARPDPPLSYDAPHRQRSRRDAGAGARNDPASERAAAPGAAEGKRQKSSALSDELAATGIGREERHDVVRVRFEAEATPSAVVTVRYEYRDALTRLGVLPAPCDDRDLARRERARGFEDGFAPDPYRSR